MRAARTALLSTAILVGTASAAWSEPPPGAPRVSAAAASPGLHRGVALGLFSEDEGFSYRPLLDEA